MNAAALRGLERRSGGSPLCETRDDGEPEPSDLRSLPIGYWQTCIPSASLT
jgi:hypothetical protein